MFRLDEEQWVAVFPLMLKKTALRFYKDHVKKKGLVETILFPVLVQLFKQGFSTKERGNELWFECNSLDWADMVAQYPTATKEKIMFHLLERFDTLRRWLATLHFTDEMHKQRLLFAVANLDECFITRARQLDTLREVKQELLCAVSTFGAGRAPRKPLTVATTSTPLLADALTNALDDGESSMDIGSPSIMEGEQMMADRNVHRTPTKYSKQSNSSSSGNSTANRAPSWMTCFVCNKKGCWSRNHTKE